MKIDRRPAFRRDTSFSAWLGDDDEEQIRMNEKVPTNLPATLRKPALLQGRLTHISYIPAENVPHNSNLAVITMHSHTEIDALALISASCLVLHKLKRQSTGCTREDSCQGTFSHIWNQSRKYRRIHSRCT